MHINYNLTIILLACKWIHTWSCVFLCCRALLPWLPANSSFLLLLGIAVSSDPVVELLTVSLLAPPQYRQWAPCFFHHVHDAVEQLEVTGSRHSAEFTHRQDEWADLNSKKVFVKGRVLHIHVIPNIVLTELIKKLKSIQTLIKTRHKVC